MSSPPPATPRRLFEPVQIGPITLRNRTIRAAAFEGAAQGHDASQRLADYHESVARGGVGMTTVAYAAVHRSGLAFPHQLWMRPEAVPGLRSLTDKVHAAGALASVQLGHCGNMAADPAVSGLRRALAPSSGFNLYGPTYAREMTTEEIAEIVRSFGEATKLAQEAGFDAVECHCGHGYLVSQFLSPYTNKRTDEYGGSLQNRMRFMREVIAAVRAAAEDRTAVLVKMNLRDGFEGGMELDEAIEVAKALETAGVDALILSGGFVSRSPMFVMRGPMPVEVMAAMMPSRVFGGLLNIFGSWLIQPVPYEDLYFLEDAKAVRAAVSLPLVYVGGVSSRKSADTALAAGFDAVAIARALIREPDFVDRMRREEEAGEDSGSRCTHCNYCAARIYNGTMSCHFVEAPPPELGKLLPREAW
ncbi:hypothetical protein DFJ74DRAFT_691323 [Hyaloraphidium curvatum]|nr:hypothetical protein DFJ74DRAFT_691323 [Hyaloraphidium curvatum]